MSDANLNEKILDEIFKDCADQALTELFDESASVDSADHQFSSEFEAGMKNLFEQERKKERLKKWRSLTPRAAIFFICLLAAACVFVLSVEAVRLRVFNFFIETEEKFSRISFVEGEKINDSENISIPEDLVLPGYMPEGFEIIDIVGSGGNYTVVYEDGEGEMITLWQIIIGQSGIEGSFSIDTEDTFYEKLIINSREVIFVRKDDELSFIWQDDGHAFMLGGKIEQKTGVKIVENF